MASGTPRKITLDGLNLNFAADVDITEEVAQEVEAIATTGEAMPKITKKVPIRGVELVVDDDDWEELQNIAEKTDDFPMSYENVNGSVYRNTGIINIESRATAENRATVTLIPTRGRWAKF